MARVPLERLTSPVGDDPEDSLLRWLVAAQQAGFKCAVIQVRLNNSDSWNPVGAVKCDGERYAILMSIDEQNGGRTVCHAKRLVPSNKNVLWYED